MSEPTSSNFTSEETSYGVVLEFILTKFEQDSNLALYDDSLFTKWIKFLLHIPDLKASNLKRRLEHHLRAILDCVKTTNLKSRFRILISEFLTKRVGVRQEIQRFAVDYIQGILVLKPGPSMDFHKSVALYQLLFIDTPSSIG
mmetsp:Transcript_44843/g.59551  ORF Transcript_44843/g.59551 Transcript_44843/m.59551 type:complete len:143 (+) Transcript_44843:1102-1530(+)